MADVDGAAGALALEMMRPLLLAALCLAVVACAAERRSTTIPSATEVVDDYPLQRPSVIEQDFLWHQDITATVNGERFGFQAYVGKEGDTLTVIGLSPVGTSWFELVQRGLEVDYWSVVPHALPLPPRYVLTDIQRCYFPVTSDPAPTEGVRSVMLEDTEVTEVWRNGELRERRFGRTGNGTGEMVTVRYEAVDPQSREARQVVVENTRFGYVLQISTVDQTAQSRGQSNEPAAPD